MTNSLNRKIVRDFDAQAWSGARLLVTASCDVKYVQNAMALIRSLDVCSPGFDFLLHVVNPGPGTLGALDRFAEELTATRLHISAETVQIEDPRKLRTYFACARLMILPDLLERSNAPVFVVDADGLFIAPIDLDFTDKTDANICLCLRQVAGGEDKNIHLKVAAGAIWAAPTDTSRRFFQHVRSDIEREFAEGEAAWFLDQKVLAVHANRADKAARIFNIKTKYIDWNFRSDSIIWTGKGNRKHLDVGYTLLRLCFDSDPDRRRRARRLWQETVRLRPVELRESLVGRIFGELEKRRGRRVGIYLPRLDLPWKQSAMAKGGPAPQTPDAVELRLWWKRFTMALSLALTRYNIEPVLVEIPAWDITPQRVDEDDFDLAFIPHRCHLDFEKGSTPVMFYMQEYFRHVFVADPQGWSAASSKYPINARQLPPAVLGGWDDYRARFAAGQLDSKFEQRPSVAREALVASGDIPARPFAFFPLQIPHDQSLLYFSDVEEAAALEAVVAWSRREGIPLVLKGHPANMRSMAEFMRLYQGEGIYWSNAHVHDLLKYAKGVITLNSGVGFEAIVAGRPLVTLARAEYDAASHRATLDTIASAWKAATTEDEDQRLSRYARFTDWFLCRYAIDLSRPAATRYALDRVVRDVIKMIRTEA